MEELNSKFLKLFTEKEQLFILLNMERIKEEDNKYLKTLSKEQLIKLRDNIKNICKNILDIDNKLIEFCKDIKNFVKDENDKNYKLFKHYLNLNNELNTYLLILMSIPLTHIDIYKQYHDSKINIISIFYKNNSEILLDGFQEITPPAASPPKAEALKAPKSASPPKAEALKAPQKAASLSPTVSSGSDKFTKSEQCNISSLLAKDSEYPFLNAIFEYGMYKKNLQIIYNRLLTYYHHIETADPINFEVFIMNYKYIFSIIMNMQVIIRENISYDYNLFSYNLSTITTNYKNSYKDCIYKEYKHNDKNETEFYKLQLNNFINFMFFIHNLYIHTLGKNNFINNIKKYLENKNINNFEKAGWVASIIDQIIEYLQFENTLNDEESYNKILIEYTIIANNKKIINKKIIEKIFNQKGIDGEIFHIIYTKIYFTYKQYFTIEDKKNFKFKFFKEDINKDNKNYIRILEDSDNKYFNVFTTEDDDTNGMA